ncbi:LysE family translocator [Bradyrhizobium ontarionense]|uniref:LysE family translocator n=1 Tax=Bradyrhizobium ontarionense TaxID=2898149 RepID=A0ABY3RBW4_9BRAD|nr:LysE family translocator [Bradyrhizobium sp. A19]UFZ04870.1 LysE family translocator [Bradyrhizobium sp. A19]
MNALTLFSFAIVAFIGIATPGPTVLLALTNGSRVGVRRACAGIAGAVASDFILIGAVAVGLGALLAASEFWFSVVKWIGVAYLAYLGLMLLRSSGSIDLATSADGKDGSRQPHALFLKSFLVAITNPKGYLFFSAFLPQFVVPSAPQLPQYLTLALTFAMLDVLIMLAYASAGSQAMCFLKRSGALWLDRICGGALLSLAGALALYRRAGP